MFQENKKNSLWKSSGQWQFGQNWQVYSEWKNQYLHWKFSIFTGKIQYLHWLSFKVVCVDCKGRSSLLRCCLKSMQNRVLWLLVCNKYAATTCEHGIVFSLKRMEIMLWHIASRLLVLGECFFSIKFRN